MSGFSQEFNIGGIKDVINKLKPGGINQFSTFELYQDHEYNNNLNIESELEKFLTSERIEDNVYEIEHFLSIVDTRYISEKQKIKLEALEHLVNIFGRSGVSTQLQPWELISTMTM